MSQVARQFYVDWQVRGENPDELIKLYQSRFGITWHQANSIHRWVKGMVDSLGECQKRQISDITGQIQSAIEAVKKWSKQVKDAAKKARRKRNPVIPDPNSQQKLRCKLHNKNRRIAKLQAKARKTQESTMPSHLRREEALESPVSFGS